MNNKLYSARDLENRANDMSSYGGDGFYDGTGDDFLDYGGDSGSFADPINSGKLYTLTLTNTNTTAARTAVLCPGLIRNAVGLIADGTFNDFSGAAGLTAAGGPMPVAFFNAYIDKFPTVVLGFKISTNNVTQLDQVITIQKQSPFKQYSSRIIQIGVYANEINPNTGLLTVPVKFYMDQQTMIQYPVLPSTSVSFIIAFGASLNIATALRTKDAVIQTNKVAVAAGALPSSNYSGRSLGR